MNVQLIQNEVPIMEVQRPRHGMNATMGQALQHKGHSVDRTEVLDKSQSTRSSQRQEIITLTTAVQSHTKHSLQTHRVHWSTLSTAIAISDSTWQREKHDVTCNESCRCWQM